MPPGIQYLALATLAILSALTSVAGPASAERRIALVIGNSQYQAVPKLNNPVNDAQALSTVLRSLGFDQVTVKTELGRDQFMVALRDFAREADKADWAVVYYSGHGLEVGGVNYMIPIDARLETDRSPEFEAIELSKVTAAVDGAHKLRLVILDACRNNPFINQMRRTVASRSIGRGLVQVEPEVGTLVVYAAKHGEVARDGTGPNSPFMTSLLTYLPTPNLEVRRMFDLVRDDVLESTERQQQPFTYGSLSGKDNFYFHFDPNSPSPQPAPPPAPSLLQDQAAREAKLFALAQNDLAKLKYYRDNCTLCQFRVAAQSQIHALEEAASVFTIKACNETDRAVYFAFATKVNSQSDTNRINAWRSVGPRKCEFFSGWVKGWFGWFAYNETGTWSDTDSAWQYCVPTKSGRAVNRVDYDNYQCGEDERKFGFQLKFAKNSEESIGVKYR